MTAQPQTDVDDLLANAERYASTFAAAGLPPAPARGLAVVACMDSRIDLFALLGLRLGQAHILRNAGGLVTDDVLRSLTLSQSLLGTRSIIVIGHTSCGLLGSDEQLRRRVSEQTGAQPPWPLGAFDDVDASVRRQVKILRTTPHLIVGETARGFVYEVESGRLREVT